MLTKQTIQETDEKEQQENLLWEQVTKILRLSQLYGLAGLPNLQVLTVSENYELVDNNFKVPQ